MEPVSNELAAVDAFCERYQGGARSVDASRVRAFANLANNDFGPKKTLF